MVINVAKRAQVHTPEATTEINEAIQLVDPDYVAAKDACSDPWNRLKSLTDLYITPDQKGSNLAKSGKPGYRWLEEEDDEILPEGSSELPEGWEPSQRGNKSASEEYTAAKDLLGKVRKQVQEHLSRAKTKEVNAEYHRKLETNMVDDISSAIATLDAPSRTMKKIAATRSSDASGSTTADTSFATEASPTAPDSVEDEEELSRELELLVPPDPAIETVDDVDGNPFEDEDPYEDEDAPEDSVDAPPSDDPDERFFNEQSGRLNNLEAKMRQLLREGTEGPQQKKFDKDNRFSESTLTSFDEERKKQLEEEGIGNIPMEELRLKYLTFVAKLLKSDQFSGFTCPRCRQEQGPDVDLKVYTRTMFLKHLRRNHQPPKPRPEREVFMEQVQEGDNYSKEVTKSKEVAKSKKVTKSKDPAQGAKKRGRPRNSVQTSSTTAASSTSSTKPDPRPRRTASSKGAESTIDMTVLRAHEAREGDVQRAEEAVMRHISRSPFGSTMMADISFSTSPSASAARPSSSTAITTAPNGALGGSCNWLAGPASPHPAPPCF
ncbi:hypothetical protein FRC04_001268 [Tulasnella sp. 424]|nr:hypothetical protein FRC04_001268 [Tulasnella sp. 424]